ncbi:uncharacterized protein LOC144878141 [Branchiostoma floridae x Branchiostoma japonicum]
MDVTPMEEAMMQQFSGNIQALQKTLQNASSQNPSDAIMDKNKGSTDAVVVVPTTVKTRKCKQGNNSQKLQEATGDSNAEEVTQDDGTETIDVDVRPLMSETVEDDSDSGGNNVEDTNSTESDMDWEPENDKIDSDEESSAQDNEEAMPKSRKKSRARVSKQPLSCSQCSKHFKMRKTLETHMKKVHDRTFLCCHVCHKGYETQEILDEHLLKLHNVKKTNGRTRFVGPFTCDACQKVFERRKTFTDHKQRCGTDKVYFPCQSCSKVFQRRDSLRHHTQKYHSEVPPQHQCEVCGMQFYRKDKLNRHMVVHFPAEKQSLIKKFKCDACGNRYCSKAELEIHTRTHTGEKPYLCEHCGKCFTCQRDAKKHILRMHSNWRETAKRHFCSVCNKSFLEKSTMLKHVNAVHADHRPYPCDQCEYRGKNKRDLQRHQNRHMADKPFSCLFCDKSYNSNEALNYHKRAHHGMDKVYKCTDCTTEFHVREAYNHHMKSHKRESEIDTAIDLVLEGARADIEEEEEKPEEIVADKKEN